MLPPIWQAISKVNPIVYMISGFRYGFLGTTDVPILVSVLILVLFIIVFVRYLLEIKKAAVYAAKKLTAIFH